MEKLAQALRGAMLERNHSAHKAAAAMGVSATTVINWSKGWVARLPDPEHWPIIADYIGVPTFVLLEWVGLLNDEQVDLLRTIPGSLRYRDGLALAMAQERLNLNWGPAEVLAAS
jgi:hypothetical protein